jgi:hypothetical protein
VQRPDRRVDLIGRDAERPGQPRELNAAGRRKAAFLSDDCAALLAKFREQGGIEGSGGGGLGRHPDFL